MFDFLTDNLLIITPNSYKKAILNYLEKTKKIFNIKFMTLDEYKRKLLFDYDENAIHYLVKKGLKVENAITILNNLYYIEDKRYDNDKLNYLIDIKNELDKNDSLIYDKLFHKMLTRKKIVVYGYGKLDKYYLSLLSNTTIIPYDIIDKKYDIYHFINIKDEVEFVFQKIVDLLKSGININKISLMNIDSDYIPYLKMMEKFYDLKIDFNSTNSLMGTILGNTFYNLVLENKTKEEILELIKKYEEEKDYSFIINLLNKYDNLIEYQEEIKYELLNKLIKKDELDNVIRIKNIFDYIDFDEHVFLLNFNNGNIPKLQMDTNYITDSICYLVNKSTTEEENELIKANTLNYLSSIENITISYKDKSFFKTYYPSILLDYINYEIKEFKRSLNYSNLANQSIYTMYLDDYAKYGVKNKDLDLLYSNYDRNNYLEYDNNYKGVSKANLMKLFNDKLTISYTSINNYYQCGFKYYLGSLLKVDEFEEKFSAYIGKLFHYCLSKMNEDDFELDKEYYGYINNKEFTNKEKFFLDKLKDELAFIIKSIKRHQFISGFTNMLYEENINIKLMDSPYVNLTGFIDKIMYKEKDNCTLISIIDYKTNKPDISLKNLQFGLSMQLPIYLYLVSNYSLFKNIKFTGFYLEHILDINIKKSYKKTIDEQKYDNLKLVGYSTDNIERLSIFDSTYENSEMIRGIKLTKDGNIGKTANVLNDDKINEIIKLTHEKIIEAMNDILAGKFTINPKILNGRNISCENCIYKDICYHDEKDNVYLKVKEDDDNA